MNENQKSIESRKADHIELAFQAQVNEDKWRDKFYYEPLFTGNYKEQNLSLNFLGKTMRAPVWISSMTGGTEKARLINENLGRLCNEFGLGMGLGSCRPLLSNQDRWEDFNLRPIIGSDSPFYANLGIAQIEQEVEANELYRVNELLYNLDVDGLIIHVNTLQEWAQEGGDVIKHPPIETIEHAFEQLEYPIIVKEVGQGFGPLSLAALCSLPLAAIDFGAYGGTNFTLLEKLRSKDQSDGAMEMAYVGHDALEMVDFLEVISEQQTLVCDQFIISGGIKDPLTGYYITEKLNFTSVYGQASAFLQRSLGSYDVLRDYFETQIDILKLAKSCLRVR